MAVNMIVGIVQLLTNDSEYRDINLRNLQAELKKALKDFQGLNYNFQK